MGMTLKLESTAPFQGLPELVAYNEGLFAAEGLDIEFVKRGENSPTATYSPGRKDRWASSHFVVAEIREGGCPGPRGLVTRNPPLFRVIVMYSAFRFHS